MSLRRRGSVYSSKPALKLFCADPIKDRARWRADLDETAGKITRLLIAEEKFNALLIHRFEIVESCDRHMHNLLELT